MNKQDANKLVMMKALLSFLKLNQSVWQNSVPISEAVTALEELIGAIELIRQNTGVNQTGLVAEKKTLKAVMATKFHQTGSVLFALGSKTKDQVLQAKVNFAKSELEMQRDGQLLSTCRSMLEIARLHVSALGVYGIGEDELTEMEELIDRYEASLPSSRVSVMDRKGNNAKLKELFGDAKVLLNDQLKRLMVRYEQSDPIFYVSFLDGLKVVDYGIRHEKPEEEPTQQEG
jgi:cob(I)alamin adenosyltransferase